MDSVYGIPGDREQTFTLSGFVETSMTPLESATTTNLRLLHTAPYRRSIIWWLTRWFFKEIRVSLCQRYGHPEKCVSRILEQQVRVTSKFQADGEVTYDFIGITGEPALARSWCELCGETIQSETESSEDERSGP